MHRTITAVVVALVVPTGASAATVTRDGDALIYTAAPGATNNVDVMAAQDARRSRSTRAAATP